MTTKAQIKIADVGHGYSTVTLGRRTVLVSVDEHRNQCTVPDTEGGSFFVRGIGDRSIERAGRYALQFRTAPIYRSRAAALRRLAADYDE